MKEITINDASILSVFWDECIFETVENRDIDMNVDQLLYVWVYKENRPKMQKSRFGALKNGRMFVSDIEWVVDKSVERKIHNLIKSGIEPYEVLEFMEL